mmetsp:Transcript_33611/g.96461  ORF Transcript_33611/g.96461 Transcript_33611/m.96461 type:complete len:216 (+) Transcript_33611:494-1141(+)
MVTSVVDCYRGDPPGTADQLLQVFLFLEVVDANTAHGRHDEVRLRRMKCTTLHLAALQLAERPHRLLLVQSMDDALVGWRIRFGADGRTIIALGMPGHLLHVSIGGNSETAARCVQRSLGLDCPPSDCASLRALRLVGVLIISLRLRCGSERQHRGDRHLDLTTDVFFTGPRGSFDARVNEEDRVFCSNDKHSTTRTPSHCRRWSVEFDTPKRTA